jgi:bacterioferritin
MTEHDFSVDIDAMRNETRRDMQVASVRGADRHAVIDVLNDVLATEITCWMRYSRHAISAASLHREPVFDELTEHAEEEFRHAIMAAERVCQLGGEPEFDPLMLAARTRATLTADQTAEADLPTMLRENLAAEQIVISTYSEIIRWLGDSDSDSNATTRQMLEAILAAEREHANGILNLLGNLEG